MIIDGQFGSTGKGSIAARIAIDNRIDIAVGTLSPNAGHTYYLDGKRHVAKQIPISGIIHKDSTIYISPGSVIEPKSFLAELCESGIDQGRVYIHPRAAIVSGEELAEECRSGGLETIASTQSGTGAARASKVLRQNNLAANCPELKEMIRGIDIHKTISKGAHILVETGQGIGLGLNFGYAYPYCTSRDVIPASVLADCGAHPTLLGNVMLCFRTFPIRVGNVEREGRQVGYSGPFFQDSRELTWEQLGQPEERTTVTGRVRRVATFSMLQYAYSVDIVRPSHIFLNFINYIRAEDLKTGEFAFRGVRKPTLVGCGPYPENILPYDKKIIASTVLRGAA